jgi:uncharacterized oxidoreductase
VGADQGHKGYGLSFMVEMFSGILTGLGFGIDPLARHNDGCFIAVFKVDAFRPLAEFKEEMRDFAEYVKDTSPAKGFDRIYYPGEVEYVTEQTRLKEGIFIEDDTWAQIAQLIQQHKLEDAIGSP